MMSFKDGDSFKSIPVIEFVGYDKIIVLFNGHLEFGYIEEETQSFHGEEIKNVPAPPGIVADLTVRATDRKEMEEEFRDLSSFVNSNPKEKTGYYSIIREKYGHSEYSATKRYEELRDKLEIVGDDDFYLEASNIRPGNQ